MIFSRICADTESLNVAIFSLESWASRKGLASSWPCKMLRLSDNNIIRIFQTYRSLFHHHATHIQLIVLK